ncbi:MAG: glutamate-1-semialdehyde 2,1-aminomutase [Pseudomonadota bacterium]
MQSDESKSLQKICHEIIPGGCHTYAKGDDQFPENSPAFLKRGSGSHVWDFDDNEYIEYGMGCRAVTLGHAYPPVVEAAQNEMLNGANFCRPAPIETYCAQSLLEMVPAAEMVKFVKDGSSATTAAVKLARAVTGRDKVAFCIDHPFFATNDWFIGKTAMDAGIPEQTKSLSLTFSFNDINGLEALFNANPNEIACVILEPTKYEPPKDNFLHRVKDLCHRNGALFVLDEMITGFRWHNGGCQSLYDIEPDLSTFGKALGNGFAVSALLGKSQYMERGGLYHNHPRVFLLSTTHGAETHALAAAIATMDTYKNEPVIETLSNQGMRLKSGLDEVIANHDLQDYVQIVGEPQCLVYVTKDQDKKSSQYYRALFMQEIIKRGIIGPSFIISYSHSNDDVDKTIEAVDGALAVYSRAISDGVDRYLSGGPTQVVYRTYNQ